MLKDFIKKDSFNKTSDFFFEKLYSKVMVKGNE